MGTDEEDDNSLLQTDDFESPEYNYAGCQIHLRRLQFCPMFATLTFSIETKNVSSDDGGECVQRLEKDLADIPAECD
jgi:hypothetical protein